MYYYLNCNNKETYIGEVDKEFTEEKELFTFLKEQKLALCWRFRNNYYSDFIIEEYTGDEIVFRKISLYDSSQFYVNMDTIVSITIIKDGQPERIKKFEECHSFIKDIIGFDYSVNNKKVRKVLYNLVRRDYSYYSAVGKITKEMKKDEGLLFDYYYHIIMFIMIVIDKKWNQDYLKKLTEKFDKAGMFRTKEVKEKFLEFIL